MPVDPLDVTSTNVENSSNVSGDSVTDALNALGSDLRARNSEHYNAEYGIRTDDGALVMHFYPPGYDLESAEHVILWPNWQAFHDRFERALLATFARETIRTGYTKELMSFWAIISPMVAPDRMAAIEKFFRALEA